MSKYVTDQSMCTYVPRASVSLGALLPPSYYIPGRDPYQLATKKEADKAGNLP
jgi:hypothetical protein